MMTGRFVLARRAVAVALAGASIVVPTSASIAALTAASIASLMTVSTCALAAAGTSAPPSAVSSPAAPSSAASSAASSSAAVPSASSAASSSAAPHDYRDKNFDYFVSGDPRSPRAAHTEFLLALMGGGGSVDAAYRAIASHAGGGHIVILRAVHDDSFDPQSGDYGESFMKEWGPVTSAQTIVFHHREASYDPRVLAALRGADGIFLAGGDQANYVNYWKGTPVQEILNAHVRAKRPIGGSSAGLAILGHYSYTSLDGGSMESKVALADPFDSGVTLEGDFLHFRWLENVITDTHFSRRCRLGRLIVFIARLDQEHPRADVFGVGIDERSALLIGADGIGRMAQGSAGTAWVVMPRPHQKLVHGQPLTLEDIRIVRVDQSGSVDFKTRAVSHPLAQTVDSIEHGNPTHESIATPILRRSVVPANEG
jgi:cyanophycinase-like exopeptidase